MVKRYQCTLCDREIRDNDFIIICHSLVDIAGMCLFLSKMFSWMMWQSFTVGKLRNFPCTCGHKALWHLTMFKGTSLTLTEINWFYLLFRYKFVRDEDSTLAECFKCSFKHDYEKRCFEFQPINNLIYLEEIYKKKRR